MVPILKGTKNYNEWVKIFKIWCNIEDPGYWPIFTGDSRPEITSFIEMTGFERVNRCAMDFYVSVGRLTTDQLNAWTSVHINGPNERFTAWQDKNAIVLSAIMSTTTATVHEMIATECYASDVNAKLTKAYGRAKLDFKSYFTNCNNLIDLAYRPGMSPELFVERWSRALAEKDECEGITEDDPCNIERLRMYYVLFIRSVSTHGDMDDCIRNQRPDMDSPHLIFEAIESFITAETTREEDLRSGRRVNTVYVDRLDHSDFIQSGMEYPQRRPDFF